MQAANGEEEIVQIISGLGYKAPTFSKGAQDLDFFDDDTPQSNEPVVIASPSKGRKEILVPMSERSIPLILE